MRLPYPLQVPISCNGTMQPTAAPLATETAHSENRPDSLACSEESSALVSRSSSKRKLLLSRRLSSGTSRAGCPERRCGPKSPVWRAGMKAGGFCLARARARHFEVQEAGTWFHALNVIPVSGVSMQAPRGTWSARPWSAPKMQDDQANSAMSQRLIAPGWILGPDTLDPRGSNPLHRFGAFQSAWGFGA